MIDLQYHLKNMTILVTRPTHQAKHLCDEIIKLNGTPILFPTIEIAPPTDYNSLQTAIHHLNKTDIAIFISANAVSHSLPMIETYWRQRINAMLPETLKVAAMGPATVNALRNKDITVDIYPEKQFNSEELLAHPELQAIHNKTITLFCGEGGRELLTKTLIDRSAHVTHAIAYKRIKPTIKQLPKNIHLTNMIVCTSREGLQNLCALCDALDYQAIREMPLLVISTRMAELAQQLGFHHAIRVAKKASDTAILDELITWNTSSSR